MPTDHTDPTPPRALLVTRVHGSRRHRPAGAPSRRSPATYDLAPALAPEPDGEPTWEALAAALIPALAERGVVPAATALTVADGAWTRTWGPAHPVLRRELDGVRGGVFRAVIIRDVRALGRRGDDMEPAARALLECARAGGARVVLGDPARGLEVFDVRVHDEYVWLAIRLLLAAGEARGHARRSVWGREHARLLRRPG